MSEQRTQVIIGKPKLVVSDLGNPSMVKAKPPGDNTPHTLGVIFGRLTQVKSKTVKNGTTGEVTDVPQLLGRFEGRPNVPLDNHNGTETIAVRASVLYLPSGIVDMLVEALKGIPENEPAEIDFAFLIQSVRASNPAGYSYQVINRMPPSHSDPLAGLRQIACGHEVAQLPASDESSSEAAVEHAESEAISETASRRRHREPASV